MSLTKQFKTDSELETKGAKFELPANEDGSIPTFYLARLSVNNAKYTKTFEAATKPFKRQIALNTMPEEKAKRINVEVFVDAILTGWQNVLTTDVKGVETANDPMYADYNRENAIALLERLPELFRVLTGFATNMQNFLEAEREEEAKN